jgi:hypothetical protein
MLPPYAARIEDLGQGDFVRIDCAACHHVALLTPEALLRVGLSPAAKILDLERRLRCRGCGRKGRAVVSIEWRGGAGKPASSAGPRQAIETTPIVPATSSGSTPSEMTTPRRGCALGLRPGPGAECSTKRRLPNFTGRSVRLPATTGYAPLQPLADAGRVVSIGCGKQSFADISAK